MTDTANIELSQELYNLSGWYEEDAHPLYTLGYLLRKLPNEATSEKHGGYHYLYLHHGKQDWYAYYGQIDTAELIAWGDSPEDAAAKLAIELIKQKVLKP